MFLGNIGNEQVESIYEVRPGDNYGWSDREGPIVVELGEGEDSCDVFPLPADDSKNNYTYPVAAYRHNDPPPGWPMCEDSEYAVIAGFVYRGSALPDLRGRYVFGDGVTGRVFSTDLADMRREGQPPGDDLRADPVQPGGQADHLGRGGRQRGRRPGRPPQGRHALRHRRPG